MAHIGRQRQLGIGIEATAGTAVAPTHYIPFLKCSLEERHTPITDKGARGIRDTAGPLSVEGKKWGEGDIEVVLDPTTAPYWFALALGSIESEAGSGDKYVHTITASQENNPLTATIWLDRIIDKVQFSNAVVDSLELNFADDIAKIKTKVFSKFPTAQERTPTETELTYYTFKNAKVKIGGTETKIRELTLTIDNGAELIYAPNSNDVDRIVWKGLKVSGKFSLLFEDETQKSAFVNLAKQSLEITFSDDDNNIIQISIPNFRVDNWSASADLDDIVQEEIDFVAEYDLNDKATISVSITNEVPTYTS